MIKTRKKKRLKDIRVHILCYILVKHYGMKKKRVSKLFSYSPPAVFYILKKIPLYILTDENYYNIYKELRGTMKEKLNSPLK
jgi:hypothetical protein